MKRLVRWLSSLVLLAVLLAVLAYGAQWQGFWAGQSIYPGTERYERGRWELPPVCWAFADSPAHAWTEAEKAVARAAIAEWVQAPSGLTNRIFESTDPVCRNRPLDILLRWENNTSFFKDWGDPNRDGLAFNASGTVGLYVPPRVAPPLKIEPCPDLIAARFLERCSVVFFNRDNPNGWFVDPTPDKDEEFEPTTVTLCRVQKTMLKAKKDSPAAGKQDLYTVILHEFGHALGLVHSGGCDKNPFTGHPPDDDGAVMWEGFLTQRRDLEDIVRGLGVDQAGERVHLDPITLLLYQTLYPRRASGLVTNTPSWGREPKGPQGTPSPAALLAARFGSADPQQIPVLLAVANNASHTVALIDLHTRQVQIIPVGTFPIDVALTPDGQRAYVANFGSDDVSVIDLQSRQVVETLRVGRQPSALAFDPNPNRLYVTNFGDSSITIIERTAAGHRVMATLSGIREPLDIALSLEGRFGYVVSILSKGEVCFPIVGCVTQEVGGVLTLDLSTLQVLRTLRFEGELRQLAISPNDARLYVTARSGSQGQVLAIDPAAGQILQTIPVGQKPYGIATSTDGCFVVVTNLGSNDISVLDAKRGRLLATLRDPQAREPFGVAVLGSLAFVTNRLSHTVSVFELGPCP